MIGGELELILRSQQIDRFALAGWPLEISVHSTMRRANDIGYECILLEDLCVPLDPELQESSVSQILMSGGIFGAVGESAALLEALVTSTQTGGDA
jgi:nicotinamidase-related amidase